MQTVEWSSTLTSVTVQLFREHVGPRVPIPSNILSIFLSFMTSSIWQLIIDQTNLFALQCLGEEKYAQWVEVTVDELKAYLGFMILVGVVKLPSIYDYWKTSAIFHYSPIASRISRDRFFEISRYFHFTDNTLLSPPGTEGYDKLGKVRGILDMFKSRFWLFIVQTEKAALMKQWYPIKDVHQ